MVQEQTGSKNNINLIPYEEAFPDGGFEDMRRRVPSITKVSRLVGWSPQISLSQIVTDVIKQMQRDNQKNEK